MLTSIEGPCKSTKTKFLGMQGQYRASQRQTTIKRFDYTGMYHVGNNLRLLKHGERHRRGSRRATARTLGLDHAIHATNREKNGWLLKKARCSKTKFTLSGKVGLRRHTEMVAILLPTTSHEALGKPNVWCVQLVRHGRGKTAY